MGRHRNTSGKPISVKIATVKIIKALEDALARLEKTYASQEANEVKYEKAKALYNKALQKIAIDNIKSATDISASYRSWTSNLNIDFNIRIDESLLPKSPERDVEPMHSSSYNEQKQELENAIRILKMTDEEVVNTSTYNAVARYL